MGPEIVNQIIQAEVLCTVELEAKIVLDLLEQLAQFKGFPHDVLTVSKHTGMLGIHFAEDADYLVSSILSHHFQLFGHIQVDL